MHNTTAHNPVLVEVRRGDFVESCHCGAVTVADATGVLRIALGDVHRPVYLRSAIKFLQAMPLVTSGAATRYSLSDAQLALACASHGGEAEHVQGVNDWLQQLGLTVDDLSCGAHPPMNKAATESMLVAGEAPTALHNNCSGKHTGFLTTALHKGEQLSGYIESDHAVQHRVLRTLEMMSDVSLQHAPTAVDGCGIPVIAMPLATVAQAMARFANPDGLDAKSRDAVRRLQRALRAHPFMVAGSKRFCTSVMQCAGARALIKMGAEGCYAAALPAAGLGIALKIDDGSNRAARVAMGALLCRLAPLAVAEQEQLQSWLQPKLRNWAGRIVGNVQVAPALNESLRAYRGR